VTVRWIPMLALALALSLALPACAGGRRSAPSIDASPETAGPTGLSPAGPARPLQPEAPTLRGDAADGRSVRLLDPEEAPRRALRYDFPEATLERTIVSDASLETDG
jgi:hypothetical protein